MGHRPLAPVKIGYQNTYLYLTLCPFTGKGFAAFLPKLNTDCFRWFVNQIQDSLGQRSLFIADGAMAHRRELFDSKKLEFIKLPAACPELNPVERFFLEVRRQLKHKVFQTLQEAQQRIQTIVEQIAEIEGKVVSLTCFPYLKNTT
jgi:transposase